MILRMSANRIAKFILLFFIALLLFNFPILGLFGGEVQLADFPILYLYFFLVWAVVIAMIYWLSKPKRS